MNINIGYMKFKVYFASVAYNFNTLDLYLLLLLTFFRNIFSYKNLVIDILYIYYTCVCLSVQVRAEARLNIRYPRSEVTGELSHVGAETYT